MIAYLRGTLEEIHEDRIVLDLHGVGHEVFITRRLLGELPPLGAPIRVHTHQRISEDDHALFGFSTREERDLFRSVIGISGVGPRTAMSLLSILSPKEFVTAVQEGNVASIARAPGIGRKTAQRIIVDLQAKVGALQPLTLGTSSRTGVVGEAVQALIALGASDARAEEAVRDARLALGEDATVEAVIATALRSLHAHREAR